MNLPHVSIIMPCYNAAAHLARSVGSVQAQTFDDWELVAIDDGSGDDTAARLAAMAADDPRIRVFTQPNGGVSRARNRGLSEARGRCIAFLDADDDWHPDFLARMTGALQAEPDVVLAYCGWQNIGLSGGRAQPFVPPDYETPDKREKLFAGCRWPIHATLTRREAVTAAGGFDTALKNAEDYALWLRIAGCAPITRVAEVLAFYHFHSGTQASQNKSRAALDFLRAQRMHLATDQALRKQLGPAARALMYDALLQRGYESYWARELDDAHCIFRAVMIAGYGRSADWRHMLPALLPRRMFRHLIQLIDRARGASSPQS